MARQKYSATLFLINTSFIFPFISKFSIEGWIPHHYNLKNIIKTHQMEKKTFKALWKPDGNGSKKFVKVVTNQTEGFSGLYLQNLKHYSLI